MIARAPFVLALVAIAALVLGFGCTGESGPAGPAGSTGSDGDDSSPRPIRLLLASSDLEAERKEMTIIALRDKLFPIGSEFHTASLLDSTPSLEYMKTFDAILVWTARSPKDATALGDRLADYVDAGGGVVLAQFAFSSKGPLAGRIMTAGYSPLTIGPNSVNIATRRIDFLSLQFPLHPIFFGTDVFSITYNAQPDFSSPGLDPGAAVLARDNFAEYAVTLNQTGTVFGLNMYGGWWFGDPNYKYATQLVANCCLYAAKAF